MIRPLHWEGESLWEYCERKKTGRIVCTLERRKRKEGGRGGKSKRGGGKEVFFKPSGSERSDLACSGLNDKGLYSLKEKSREWKEKRKSDLTRNLELGTRRFSRDKS